MKRVRVGPFFHVRLEAARLAFLWLILLGVAGAVAVGQQKPRATAVPRTEIREGGPPKDGIPALVNPAFLSASEAARFLRPKDRVVGVVAGDEARAYPLRILNWHELVNDRVADLPVLVSW